jgi:hypothetical protein
MPGFKGKFWAGTTNDPNFNVELSDDVRFVVMQPEEPPGVGRHWQFYVEFAGRVSQREAGKLVGYPMLKKGEKQPGGFYRKIAPRIGTKEQNMSYCSSTWYCRACHRGDHADFPDGIHEFECRPVLPLEEKLDEWVKGDDWKTFCHKDCQAKDKNGNSVVGCTFKGKCGPTIVKGTPEPEGRGRKPGEGGQREEQEAILADVKAGKGRAYILETYAKYCQRYHAFVDKLFTQHAPVRRWMPAVYWLHGDAGTDKSRMARAVFKDSCYCKPPDSKWFDGYDGQEVLILNDLRKSTFTFSYLLDMLDRYEFRVEVKGGYVPLLAKVIIITCSKPHEELWAELGGTTNENLAQLTRRIKRQVNVGTACLEEKQAVVYGMRKSVQELRDQANWDVEDKYGDWDGEGEIPEPPKKRLKFSDDTEPPSSASGSKPTLFEQGCGEDTVPARVPLTTAE